MKPSFNMEKSMKVYHMILKITNRNELDKNV